MSPHDYWTERGKLGAALRLLRWERRAVCDMFRQTKDPVLYAQGQEWVRNILVEDVALCRHILALDVRFKCQEGNSWKT